MMRAGLKNCQTAQTVWVRK